MSSQLSSVYYGYTSYTEFQSEEGDALQGAGTQLSLRFRFCRVGGILLSATGRESYFNVGVAESGQLLIEFSDGPNKYLVRH